MERILVIEDSREIQLIIKECLKSYSVCVVDNLATARKMIESESYDLILLDIHLPDGNGFKFLSSLSFKIESEKVPIVFISVDNEPDGIVMGFTLGAYDYIAKPFDIRIFKARIDSIIKKNQINKAAQSVLSIYDIKINYDQQKIYIINDDNSQEIDLTSYEFKLLSLFCKNYDLILSRQQIIDKVWHNSLHVTDRTIDTHICNLRKKIKASRLEIVSIYGSGYSLAYGKTIEKMTA